MTVDDDILHEQVQYYRARAAEYDDWFWRVGRYDRGEEATRNWFRDVDAVRRVVRALPIDAKDVLELAPGTGIWTAELCTRVARLTAVDASSEMIELARRRLARGAAHVRFIQADLFDWRASEQYDAVVFCFWISHVPANRLDAFLANVASMLKPDGTVFFLDARREDTSTADDHVLPAPDEEVMVRRLDDGREFSIVKNFWSPTVLIDACRRAGLAVTVHETDHYFQYGIGTRRESAPQDPF